MQHKPLAIYYVAGPGAHDWAFQPLRVLQQRGQRVTLFCPAGSPAAARAQALGIPIRTLTFPRALRDLPGIVRCILALRRVFRAERPDVVRYCMLPISLWSRLAAWSAGVPVRLYKPPSLWDLHIPLYRGLEFATAWMDTIVIASSQALETAYRGYPFLRNRVYLSYYGLSLAPFDPELSGAPVREELGLDREDQVVALIANLIPPIRHVHREIGIKGHEILLQAAGRVTRENPHARFLIVGDEPDKPGKGAYRARLQAQALAAGLERQVTFTGHRADIPAVLAAADVAVVPSLSENVGGAVEPLLMEKPVVASRVGGLPDVVRDGETGLLVPPGDPDALATALLRMLALPAEERRAMGQRGRAIVRDLFDIERVVDRELALCRQLLGPRERRIRGRA